MTRSPPDVSVLDGNLTSEERQAFLLKLSDTLRNESDADAMIAAGTRLLGEWLHASRIVFAEIDDAAGVAHIREGWTAAEAERHPPTLSLADFGGPLLDDLRAGRSVRYDDVGEPPYARPDLAALASIGIRAGLSIPLIIAGKFVLNINVHQDVPRRWTDDEVALLGEVAERIWAAVIRARAEAALRLSESKYRTIFDSIGEGFAVIELILDEDGKPLDILHLEANPAYEQHTGVRGIVGKRGSDVLPDMGELVEFYASVARTGQPARIERHIEPFGRWLAAQVSRIGGEGSLQLSVVFNDITQRKQAEEALRDSETRHRLLIGSWAQAVWEADPAGVVVTDSPSWRAHTGQTLQEWLGYGWLDAIHPDDRAYAERQWRDAIAAGGLVNAEFRLRASGGGWRWTNVRAAPVLDAEGRITKWAGMNIDIHDRNMERQARDESERFSRALVEGVPQLVWRAVDGGDWTWASPQWTAYTGQREPDSHGHGWLEPLHPDDRDEAMSLWHQAEETGQLEMDVRIRHAATGRYRWFQTRATPVRAADGTIVEWLGTSTDVDDLRRLQDRQQLLVAELQHRVRNILTVVRSVFTRTAEADSPLEQVVDHFRGRLDNLARTQVVVTQSASGAVDLRSLIFDELLSVGFAESPNVTLNGPDVKLDSTTAESIGLAIHELTTNAVKYGALKIASATLAIRWSTNSDYGDSPTLNLTWTEQGVPAVPLKPSRQGFGSELIEEALPYRLGAETKLEFRGGGVRCTISLPLPEDAAASEPWETA